MDTEQNAIINQRKQFLKGTGILSVYNKKSPLLQVNLKNVPSLRILGSAYASQKGASTLMFNNSSGDHHVKLGEYAARLYRDKSMTDVMVVVQGKEFKAHKAVLACHSPYFDEVLNTPEFNDVHYLKLPSVTVKAFEILLDYIYTGELKVTCQELSDVYRAAKKLGIRGALTKCLNLLQVSKENFQNMVNLYVTSRKLDLLDSAARGFQLMVQNFEQIITTREFLDLQVDEIIELFRTDEVGARSETIVFIAALKWLDYDFLEREEHAEKIFDCVRFSLMTMEEIIACYHPPLLPGMMMRPKIQQTLMKATCYIAAKSLGQEALFSELAVKPRKFLFGGEPMVLWDLSVFDPEKYEENKKHTSATKIQAAFRGYSTRKRLEEDMCITNYAATVIQSVYRGYLARRSLKQIKSSMQWKGKTPKNVLLRTGKKSGTLKAYSKKTFEVFEPSKMDIEKTAVVYAMLAFDPEKSEANSLLQFDTKKRSWEVLTKCISPRYDARMVYLDKYLYIVGGFNPRHLRETGVMLPLKECHRYHLETGEWFVMPEMEIARCSHAVAIFNGDILAIGGKNDQNMIMNSIQRYDMSAGRWKNFGRSLNEPRMAMGCAVHKGELWIAGGITTDGKGVFALDSVWCLDRFYRWNRKPSLPQTLVFPTLTSDGNHLFCLGGATRLMINGKEELESVDNIYKFVQRRWIEQLPMPFQYHNIVAFNVENHLYLFGGFSSHTMSHIQEPVFIDLDEDTSEKIKLPKGAPEIVEATISFQSINQ